MSPRYTFDPKQVHTTALIVPGAVVIGDVRIARDVSIWYNATLRGDLEPLILHAAVNVQDNCALHTSHGHPVILHEGVSVGHGAIVHSAEVGPNTLVGMGAVLLTGAVVGRDCIVGAGAVLPGGKSYPAGHLILGVPGHVVRRLTEEELEENRQTTRNYVEYARRYRAEHPEE